MQNKTSTKTDKALKVEQPIGSASKKFFKVWLTKRFWLARGKELVFIVLAYSIISAFMQRNMISGMAPHINAVTVENQAIDLNQYSEPTLIYFWGSWCPYCRITSPMINDVSKDYRVISIAVNSGTNEDIKQYLNVNGFQFSTINDTQSLHQHWGVNTYPSIYIVNSKSEIKFVTSGISTSWGLKLRLWLSDF